MQVSEIKVNCRSQSKRTIKSKKTNAMDIFVPIALLTWITSIGLCQSQYQFRNPWWHSAGNHPLQFQQQSQQQFSHSAVPQQPAHSVHQNQFNTGSQFQYPSYQDSHQSVLQGQILNHPLVSNTEEFLDSNGLKKTEHFLGFPTPPTPVNPWWIHNPADQGKLQPVETSLNQLGTSSNHFVVSGGQTNNFLNSHQRPASTIG